MQLIDIPTEQTTAATDLLLAAVAAAAAVSMWNWRGNDRRRAALWAWAFGLLGFAAVLGAAAHGLRMSTAANRLIWMPLNLALGLVMALFVAGAVYDRFGLAAARRALPILLAIGMTFFAVAELSDGGFLVFVIYEAIAMLTALVLYGLLALHRRLAGAATVVIGVLITIAAAAVQVNHNVRVNVIWEFDHNGIFHLMQIAGVIVIAAGLRPARDQHRRLG